MFVEFDKEIEVAKGVLGRIFEVLPNEVDGIVRERFAVADSPGVDVCP